MKSEEFKNVKNGYLIDLVAKIWLEPYDPEQNCIKIFDRIFSELKKNVGSGVTGSKFTLAAVESDEDFNGASLLEHANHPDMATYTVKYSFVLIFEGNGTMDLKDIFIPHINIPDVEFCDYKWLNEYWMSSDLPVDLLVNHSFHHGPERNPPYLPENFGKFSSYVTVDAGGKVLDDASWEWHYLPDNQYTHASSHPSGYSLDSDVFMCSGNGRNDNWNHYLRVSGIVFEVERLEQWEWNYLSDFSRFESFVASSFIAKIIRTDSEFDSLPFGEKKKRAERALMAYGNLQNFLDEYN